MRTNPAYDEPYERRNPKSATYMEDLEDDVELMEVCS